MQKNKKMKHKKKCLIEMRGVMWEVRFVGGVLHTPENKLIVNSCRGHRPRRPEGMNGDCPEFTQFCEVRSVMWEV